LEDSESLEKGNVNNLFGIVFGNTGVKEDFFSGKIFPVCTQSICIFLYKNSTASLITILPKSLRHGIRLGLSLSYDITKAHGGEIKVETKEGEGSEFIIQLPNN